MKTPPPGWFLVASWVFALLFVASAALQYNDPDPLRWAITYLAAALAAVLVAHRPASYLLAAIVGIGCAVWAATLWAGVVGHVVPSDFWRKMSEKGGKVEEMREAGGLTIVAAWMAIATLVARSRRAG